MGGIVGRKRDKANKDRPKGVYKKRKTWIYREYLGVIDGKAKFGPDIFLCDIDSPPSVLHREYERITQQDRDTVNWLLKQYHASPQFQRLKVRTRGDYEDYQALLTGYICKNGRPLGQAPLTGVKRTTIRGYLDNYGAPIAANRHIQYLKAAWNWALERHDTIPDNPCQGIRLNEQTARDRYVTNDEYEAIHKLTTGWVYWAMELAFLLRARRSEIVNMRVSAITDEGLEWDRTKGSQGEITEWTPRLRKAVEGALKHSYGNTSPIGNARLLLNNQGSPISASAWNSSLQRLRPKMDALGIERFTLHDLKAKGYSDQEEQYSGHLDKSGKMDKTYNRKKRIVKPAN